MGLFERVFRGSDEMFAKAQQELDSVIADLGESAAMSMPDTGYSLACINAYLGIKVETLGDVRRALDGVKGMMLREPRTHSIFQSGVGTAIAAEIIEACKYAAHLLRTKERSITAISATPRSVPSACRSLPVRSPDSWS